MKRLTAPFPLLPASIARSITVLLIAGGLVAEAGVCATLLVPRDPLAAVQSIVASEPLFHLRFTALATCYRVEAFADQAVGAVTHAASFALSTVNAFALEQLQMLSTLKLQAYGYDIRVELFKI